MTVAQLIKKLQKFPKSRTVVRRRQDGSLFLLSDIDEDFASPILGDDPPLKEEQPVVSID